MTKRALVDKVYLKSEDFSLPTLLKFGNGQIAALSKENSLFAKVRNNSTRATDALMVTGKNVYRGPIDEPELTDQYICIRNKLTNKMRIVPVNQANLRHVSYEELARKDWKATAGMDLSNDALMKQFGGRQAARILKNRAEMRVDTEIIRSNLDKVVETTTLPEAQTEEADCPKFQDRIVPNCNREATRLEDVYDIYDIVPKALIESLEPTAKIVYNTEASKLPIKTNYLLDRIKKIQQTEVPTAKDFLNIKLIVYMDALLTIILSNKHNLMHDELSRINGAVEQDVRQRFFDPNCPPQKQSSYAGEKALTYFILLALLTSERFELDIKLLASTVCKSRLKILPFARIVNAMLKPRTDILRLQLPSVVPELAVRKLQKNK